MYFHASPFNGIMKLEPRVSNHGIPLIYFSSKKENVLVYLSNAIEKYCKETGFDFTGKWRKWASYGFTSDGVLRLEEYYPNATADTYKGVSGYIYSVSSDVKLQKTDEIPFVYTASQSVEIEDCEYIPDVYDSIMQYVTQGKLVLEKYEDMNSDKRLRIEKIIENEYESNKEAKDYRYFLKNKFPNIINKQK
ncbi:MAG: hypothetical protein NC350_03435 [Corallococcus sp.]|nr:hypothetical protein [Corallococcus sp.]